MAISDADAARIFRAVWKTDDLKSAPDAIAAGNPEVTGETWLTYLGARTREAVAEAKALRREVAELRSLVTSGGVDAERVADLLVDRIAARLEG